MSQFWRIHAFVKPGNEEQFKRVAREAFAAADWNIQSAFCLYPHHTLDTETHTVFVLVFIGGEDVKAQASPVVQKIRTQMIGGNSLYGELVAEYRG